MKVSPKQILSKQLEIIKPDKKTLDKITQISRQFVKDIGSKLKKKKIAAEVFIGGSLAKGTLVKKDKYDVDIFIRFDKKYANKEISKLLGKILGKKAKKIHGSRDYYQIIIEDIIMEIIPVLKIKNPEDALNVMDLSYFHVNYVLNKIKKKKKIADEIIIAKSFCHAQNCYGAESYIRGFSGYALELLICHYGSFNQFLKEILKSSKEKLIIDDAKFYKKNKIIQKLNESKLKSPIILIDPTFKERNALAGLSKETFDKFKQISKKFLKSPSADFFKLKNISRELIEKYGKKLKIIEVKTTKQAGDIAGTKSKRFLEFLVFKLKKEFAIELAEFDYDEKKNLASLFFILGKKSDELIKGPFLSDKNNVKRFKKAHKNAIIKNKSIYAKISHNLTFEQWFRLFNKKEKKIIKEMSIKKIRLIKL